MTTSTVKMPQLLAMTTMTRTELFRMMWRKTNPRTATMTVLSVKFPSPL
ncbi:AlpA family phage regulatory protein [Escherichia coli]|nr:AlpA family phage regulatory protein [Escherichia coli]